jgi:hypothetical protein
MPLRALRTINSTQRQGGHKGDQTKQITE